MAINLTVFKQLWGRVGERPKLIGAAILAFVLGSMWGGRASVENSNGRYVICTVGDESGVLDTRSGQIWLIDHTTHLYKRGPALPYF